MKYAVVGKADDTRKLVERLDKNRVKCFVDSYSEQKSIYDKVTLRNITEYENDYVFVIPDSPGKDKVENYLQSKNINRYIKEDGARRKYILFGAGDVGSLALNTLGYDAVYCFCDNGKAGEFFCGKDVISFDELVAINKDFNIMITSTKYWMDIADQLINSGIRQYEIFPEVYPFYSVYGLSRTMDYTEILSNYKLSQYSHIGIYGVNSQIDRILMEVAYQCGINSIEGIIRAQNDIGYSTLETIGIPEISINDAIHKCDCLIINCSRASDPIRDWLRDRDIKIDVVDIFDVEKFIPAFYHPELIRFKNIHKGERVFIIGNGPSLRIEDLETLHEHGEICFGVNKIFRIYNKTNWRADYLCLCDVDVIDDCREELEKVQSESQIFLGDAGFQIQYLNEMPGQYLHLQFDNFFPNDPGFSDDISKLTYQGYSVTYDMCIQIAAYMGFKEMYLIGNDCTSVGSVTDKRNHFMDYFKPEEAKKYAERTSQMDHLITSFRAAESYSRKKGFRIYNATRGGALEEFERVNFDELFA